MLKLREGEKLSFRMLNSIFAARRGSGAVKGCAMDADLAVGYGLYAEDGEMRGVVPGTLSLTRGTNPKYAVAGVDYDDELAAWEGAEAASPELPLNAPERAILAYDMQTLRSSALRNFSDPSGRTDGMISGPIGTTGKIGGAYQFDGVDDDIDIAAILLPTEFTVSAWVKPTLDNLYGCILTNGPSGGASNGFKFWHGSDAKLHWENGDGAAGEHLYSTGTASFGAWTHVAAVVRRASSITFLFNGVAEAPQSLTKSFGLGNTLSIGAMTNHYADSWYKGIIDEPRLYPRALSSDEIRALYLESALLHATPALSEIYVPQSTLKSSMRVRDISVPVLSSKYAQLRDDFQVVSSDRWTQVLGTYGAISLLNQHRVSIANTNAVSGRTYLHSKSAYSGNAFRFKARYRFYTELGHYGHWCGLCSSVDPGVGTFVGVRQDVNYPYSRLLSAGDTDYEVALGVDDDDWHTIELLRVPQANGTDYQLYAWHDGVAFGPITQVVPTGATPLYVVLGTADGSTGSTVSTEIDYVELAVQRPTT